MPAPIPETRHIGAWLQEVAARHPERPALIEGETRLDWAGFARRLRRLGHALLGLGLNKGDRVALMLPDSMDYLVADYGVMSAGLVRVPMDQRLPRADLLALLKSSGARAVITTPDHAAIADPVETPDLAFTILVGGGGELDFARLIEAASDAPLPAGDPEDLATLNYSGGTTGAPKGIMLTHRNLATVMRHTILGFDTPGDIVFVNVRPLWPIAQVGLMAHLAAGGTVHLAKFDPANFADLMQATGAQRTSLVPTQLFRVLDHCRPNDPRFEKLEAIYIGGSRLPPEVFTRARDLIGPRIGVLYGMTEAPISSYLSPRLLAEDPERAASVGRPVPDCTIRIDGPDGPTDTPGVTGEVIVRGAHVMPGYWHNRAATEAALKSGWLHTGDLGSFDEHGILSIVGRLKEVIRTGATSVVPAEVEDVLTTHPAIAEAAVTGMPDPEWGEAVTGFVVLKPGMPEDAADIIAHCKARLAGFKCPRTIRFVPHIPRSHYGKVMKPQLLALVGA